MSGLPDGQYSVQANTLGDISSPDGSNTKPTFAGEVSVDRGKLGFIGGQNFKITSKVF